MRTYIGTKIILAEPCEKSGTPGYRVVYPDGYESWSPQAVFEEAYHPTSGMNFGLALEAAKKGYRIARAGWNGKGQWVELGTNIYYRRPDGNIKAALHEDIGSKALVFCGTRGRQMGWLASQSDMLADDWAIVEV